MCFNKIYSNVYKGEHTYDAFLSRHLTSDLLYEKFHRKVEAPYLRPEG